MLHPAFSQKYGLWIHPGEIGFWDLDIANELASTRYYHNTPIDSKNPVIVDIGGHIGIFSKWVAERYPNGHVFYVEPHPDNFAIAKRNLERLNNVTMIEAACTYEKDVEFWSYKDKSNPGGSQLLPKGSTPFWNGCEHQVIAPPAVITLDEIIEQYHLDFIDLLKLDCEGSEFSILQNCDLSKLNKVVGEWHDGLKFHALRFSHLRQFRFDPHSSMGEYFGLFALWNRKWNKR